MNCRKFVRWLPLYAGGDLSPRRSFRVEGHLRRCESCRQEAAAFREGLEEIRRELHSLSHVWREPAWRRAVIRAAGSRRLGTGTRRAGSLRDVWAYALLALLAVGLSYLVLAPLPEGDALRAAFAASTRDGAASGGHSLASASRDQDIVSMTLISSETGLKVQWFLNRNFKLQEDIE